MPPGRRAVAICGHIGSGKSTFAKSMAEYFGWNEVSFGRYVKAVADDRGIEPARLALQDLGQALIVEAGEDRFLQTVVEFHEPTSPVVLFDGVRHMAMVEAIRRHYDATLIICLLLDDRVRYERHIARGAEGVAYDRFLSWNDHAVECEIERICQQADLKLDAALPVSQMIEVAVQTLRAKGFLED